MFGNSRYHKDSIPQLVNYMFTMKWTAEKEHLIADALSRAPVFPGEEDAYAEQARVSVCRKVKVDPALNPLLEAAADPAYQAMVSVFRAGPAPATCSATRGMANIWAEISILDIDQECTLLLYQGCQIVVPASARPSILAQLHASHSGIGKTYQLARLLYY
jgi:hypothetical protein